MNSSESSTRVAFVVGAAGGIGSALTRRLLCTGWRVGVCGRSPDRLATLRQEIEGIRYGGVADASVLLELERAYDAAVAELGGITGVVNCAGSLLLKPAHLTTAAEWSDTLNANLTTAFNVVRVAAEADADADADAEAYA